MRIRSATIGLGLLLTLPRPLPGQSSPALYPHDTMNTWGAWGAEDERGAANYIRPEDIVAAARLIRTGRTFSLAAPLDNTGPVYPGRLTPHHTMVATGADVLANPATTAPGRVHFADDYIYMPLQGSTQWDALSHAWYDGKLYNGFSPAAIRSAPGGGGATRLGIQNVKDRMVGRGVLIDIVRFKGGDLPPGTGITRADIEGALARQNVQVRQGDIVLLRTGVLPSWYASRDAAFRQNFFRPQTGILKDVIPWIKERRVAGVAADNIALERMPNPDDPRNVVPLHGNILRDLGVYIGEIWWLEELADDCAADGRYEFFLCAQPLNITGAVGSPINPIAIK